MFGALAATVAQIHEMGGVAVVPHPLSYLTFSIGEGALRALRAGSEECRVDGIELRNPSYAGRVRQRRAAWLNEHIDKLPVPKEEIQEYLKTRTW